MSKAVQYRKLGNSGLKVSVPILGAMSFGSSEWASWILDEEASLSILKAAWDRGINTIDTANVYSNGVSEKVIGRFMKQYDIPRNQIVIATKCQGVVASTPAGFKGKPTPQTPEYINQYGLSRAAIFNAVEASLERLQTPYIDLLQIHRYDPDVTAEETMKALHDLVQNGKVRYIGASSMRTWQFAHLNEVAAKNGWTKFVSMQSEYSLLYREEEREMIPYCKFHGIGLIPWRPVAGGDLCRPLPKDGTVDPKPRSAMYKGTPYEFNPSEAEKTIISRVEEVATKYGKNMSEVALAWVCTKIDSPIVGTSSIKRLEENIVDKDFVLSEEEMKYLEEPYVPVPVRGHR